jgi:hypothetical protein
VQGLPVTAIRTARVARLLGAAVVTLLAGAACSGEGRVPSTQAATQGAASVQTIAEPSDRTRATAATAYRFARRPTAVFARLPPSHQPFFQVYFRLNRRLPRIRTGSEAALLLDGMGDNTRPATNSRRRHCYVQEFELTSNAPQLQHPRTGQRVTITLLIHHRPAATATTTLHQIAPKDFTGADNRFVTRAGCVRVPE